MKTTTAIERARIAMRWYGLDLDKDYFELESDELTLLGRCQRAFGYDGRNYLGRSRHRQFWYYLQRGWKKYIEMLKERQQSEKDAH